MQRLYKVKKELNRRDVSRCISRRCLLQEILMTTPINCSSSEAAQHERLANASPLIAHSSPVHHRGTSTLSVITPTTSRTSKTTLNDDPRSSVYFNGTRKEEESERVKRWLRGEEGAISKEEKICPVAVQ